MANKSVTHADFKRPSNTTEVIRPPPPPPTWTQIPRNLTTECTEKLRKERKELLTKPNLTRLDQNPQQHQNNNTEISKPKGSQNMASVSMEDYRKKGKPIDCAVMRSLKDPTNYLVRPHPLPKTGRPYPVSYELGTGQSNAWPNQTEYHDTISSDGMKIFKSSQQFLNPYPVYRRASNRCSCCPQK